MRKDENTSKTEVTDKSEERRPNRQQRRSSNRRKGKGNSRKPKLDTTRSNNPAWYYADAQLAEQVSQMSFQNLAGEPITLDGFDFDVPNIIRVHLNPSPGVQTSSKYNTALAQNSAMNLAAFRLYSKLSAFTGRVQNYAPQDVATMILAFSEVISMFEFIRRAFGVAYTMNMRNRDYPRHVLAFGMMVDPDDLFINYSSYRTRFNALVTMFNQLPIPKNVAYFDKCAAIYEKIYLDSPSSMAQTIVPVPHTTWMLDEQSYSGGSVLRTTQACSSANFKGFPTAPNTMAFYLSTLENMIGALLNSSSLHVVYTDIMNYAAKQSMEMWKMDYLIDGYTVVPVYDLNFLLQMHNATVTDMPSETTFVTGPLNVTPWNDVYPDANNNSIYYNPSFETVTGFANVPRTGADVLIDMLTDNPSLTDRVEVTRYISSCNGTPYTNSANVTSFIDAALPDHYVVAVDFEVQTSNFSVHRTFSTMMNSTANWMNIASLVANISWAPRFYEVDANGVTGHYTGDINYYTTVDAQYLRKLHDFVGLALYDVR